MFSTLNDIDLKKWKLIEKFKIFTDSVHLLKWSSDDKLMAVSRDNNAVVIEKSSKGIWGSSMIMMEAQYRSIMDCCWSQDGNKYALAGGNGCVYIGTKVTQGASVIYNTDIFKKCT